MAGICTEAVTMPTFLPRSTATTQIQAPLDLADVAGSVELTQNVNVASLTFDASRIERTLIALSESAVNANLDLERACLEDGRAVVYAHRNTDRGREEHQLEANTIGTRFVIKLVSRTRQGEAATRTIGTRVLNSIVADLTRKE